MDQPTLRFLIRKSLPVACFSHWDVERQVPGDEPSPGFPRPIRVQGRWRAPEQGALHEADAHASCAISRRARHDDASHHLDDPSRPGAARGRRRSTDE